MRLILLLNVDTKESGKDSLRWLWRKYRPDGAPEEV